MVWLFGYILFQALPDCLFANGQSFVGPPQEEFFGDSLPLPLLAKIGTCALPSDVSQHLGPFV